MKVLILNSLYHPNVVGGAEKSVQILAETLLANDHTPVIACTSDRNFIAWVNGVKVYYVKVPNLYWMRRAAEQASWKKPLWHLLDANNPYTPSPIAQIIRIEQPDVMHTNVLAGFSVGAWKAARDCRLPIVHTIRDHYLLCPRSELYHNGKKCEKQCLKCRLFSIPKRKTSALVDAVTGVGKYILNEHLTKGYFPKAKVSTHIYNPVQLPRAESFRESKTRAGRLRFGYVGMLVEGKGIEFLLKRFSENRPGDAELRVFGRANDIQYENYLKETYQADNIHFEGRREPEEIYTSIDVAVVPSLRDEAFGRIVPEANSYGKPVLVSNRGALPEIVRHGQTGFIFDLDRKGDFEQQVKQIMRQPQMVARMAPECLKAAAEYDRVAVMKQYLSVYEEVAR